jgi:hypothetical protein
MAKPDKNEQIWIVSFEYTKILLSIYRNKGFWFTSNQSWKLMQWNALGPVLMSEDALRRFLENPKLEKGSKAKDYGGIGNARCFVAEHMYPTKLIQKLTLKKFSENDPSFEEYVDFMSNINRICYVWHEEDAHLRDANLTSSLPEKAHEDDIFARYKAVGIKPIATQFESGTDLFKFISKRRAEGCTLDALKGEMVDAR